MPIDLKLDRIILKHPKGASVEVLFYGASVISWQSPSPSDTKVKERLFVSSKAVLDGSKPVRGGIPVVFPAFGPPTHPQHAKLPQHGFARSEIWKFGGTVLDNDAGVSVELLLEPTPTITAKYDQPFELAYVVTLAEHQISTDLHVKNTGGSGPLEFQALFHTYIAAPANDVRITPLHGVNFYDKTEVSEELRAQAKVETRDAVDVKKFTDSVYEDAPGSYQVNWAGEGVSIKTKNLKDLVVWNPQAEAGSKIGDMEDGGWEKYVCVEPGYVRGFVALPAGETWIGHQTITVTNGLTSNI